MQTIRVGSKGDAVAMWQRVLVAAPKPDAWTNAKGEARTWSAAWHWPIEVDGDFGAKTLAATEAWQAANALVADGVVGPKTWGAAGLVTDATPGNDPASTIPFVPAKNFTRGRTVNVRVLVIHATHSAEKPGSARNTARWFETQPKRGELLNGVPWGGTSAHYTVDKDEIIQSVQEGDTAWHARSANGYSIGIEHVGMADQTAIQWGDDYSRNELARSAALVAELAIRYDIPIRRLTLDEIRNGASGLCGHVDVTKAYNEAGGHYDPGEAFPWPAYLDAVRAQVAQRTGVATVAGGAADDTSWVEVVHAGVAWRVAPSYLGPVGIGEAVALATERGCVLPSPGLVDAIWNAATLKLDAAALVRTDLTTMTSPEVLADQKTRIATMIGARTYTLLAGAYKDVVRHPDGRVGLYGWQRANGSVIQPFYAGHASAWRDYSQGLRLVRRVTATDIV